MQLIQWTLFIDMLGYRDINGAIDSDVAATDFISFMETNKNLIGVTDNDAVKNLYKNGSFNLYKYYEIHTCFVSDSLIITYKPKDIEEPINLNQAYMHSANTLFIITMRLMTFIFNCFREKKLFLRGGISNKYCYIKDNFAVGEGLIEAYLAESTIAKNPRIILHPEIEKNIPLMQMINFLSNTLYGGNLLLKKDTTDNIISLDYLGYMISSIDLKIPMIAALAKNNPTEHLMHHQVANDYFLHHMESVTYKIKELSCKLLEAQEAKDKKNISSVLEKFLWLKQYHNSKIDGNENFSKYIIH